MPRNSGTVTVKPVPGEVFRYQVESWGQRTEPHIVDLLAFDGVGACSCKDWETTCYRNMKRQLGYRDDFKISYEDMAKMAHKLKIIWYGTTKDKNPARIICKHNQLARMSSSNYLTREVARNA